MKHLKKLKIGQCKYCKKDTEIDKRNTCNLENGGFVVCHSCSKSLKEWSKNNTVDWQDQLGGFHYVDVDLLGN